jgi:hypothetical protein
MIEIAKKERLASRSVEARAKQSAIQKQHRAANLRVAFSQATDFETGSLLPKVRADSMH